MAIDPVCRMQVQEDEAAATAEHSGKQYYFCSQGCKEEFTNDPEHYIQALDQESEHKH
ncbi:MAG: YHS domain-containing protein [Acidiferrobacterales bacterium]